MDPRIPADHPALFKGEKPMKAVLADGGEITVLARKGHDLYSTPGRSANFGGVAETKQPELHHFFIPLKNGKTLQFFVNETSGLIVLDIVNKRATGGCEYIRKTIDAIKA